jgi:hypothetical protein
VLKISEEEEIKVLGARKRKTESANDWKFGLTEGEEMKENAKERENKSGECGGYFRKEVLRIVCGKGKNNIRWRKCLVIKCMRSAGCVSP